MSIRNTIGTAIKEARQRAHLSQIDLAAKIGMAAPQLCNIEGGKNLPSIKTLEKISKALEIPFETLLIRYNEKPGYFEDAHGRSVPRTDTGRTYTLTPVRKYEQHKIKDAAFYSDIMDKLDRYFELERELGIPSATQLQISQPVINDERGAEILAGVLRASCSVGIAPVILLPSILESRNVKIIKAAIPGGEQSRSYYAEEFRSLIIVIGEGNTPERETYRLAFELGYACLYASTGFQTVLPDETAHRFVRRFAAAFLMPEEAVRADAALLALGKKDWTFEILLRVKCKYGVSAEAFALRLEVLGLIDRQLREYFRDKLRENYENHPEDKEPFSQRNSIWIGTRLELLELRAKVNK